MTDDSTRSTKRPGEAPDRTRWKAAFIAVSICLVAVAAVLVINRDRLLVKSDVSTPTNGQPSVPTANNTAPVITGLAALTERIQPFTITEIQCDASDPDGDPLAYEWTVSSGEVFGEGPRIEWGSPATEGLYRVTVVVSDGRGGTAQESLSLSVRANTKPEVVSLTADTDWTVAGGSVFLSCVAADPDGDDVSFAWTATGGALYGQGKSVVWLAPDDDGIHWITVVARDAYGAESERKLSISVTSGEPPEIVELTVAGVNTDLLLKRGDDWHVYRGRAYIVTCVLAEQAEGLTYAWTLEGFHMAGDGPTTTYTAPSGKATQTVAVTVTDQAGNAASASIVFQTETCTCSF